MNPHCSTPKRALTLAAALFLLARGAAAQTLPVANAGEDQSFPCAPVTGAMVTLHGELSSDPDDPLAVLTYTWSGEALGGATVTGSTPTVLIAPGVHTITLTVDDGVDGTATDDVMVTVVADTEPPQLTMGMSTVELWPPNHKYHALVVSDFVQSASDTCDTGVTSASAMFTGATSDEADEGKGDGNTTQDVSFEDGCGVAMVRSERAGPGDGRVYHLVVTVRDAAGNSAEGEVTVSVPHDRAHDAVDSGEAATYAAESCGPVELCPPLPSPTCAEAPQADVVVDATGKAAPALRWRARDFAADAGEFSDPAVDYQLCVYTQGAETAVLEDAPSAPHGVGWSFKKKGGASFRGSKSMTAGAIDELKLAEKDGEGSLSLALRDETDLPTLPLGDGTALVLQLMDSQGDCVGSTFADPERNDADRYEAEIGGKK